MLFSVCALYVALAVVFPIAALLMTSLQRFATVILSQAQWTLANYQTALSLGAGAGGARQQHHARASASPPWAW